MLFIKIVVIYKSLQMKLSTPFQEAQRIMQFFSLLLPATSRKIFTGKQFLSYFLKYLKVYRQQFFTVIACDYILR